jgi:O-antigen ligase
MTISHHDQSERAVARRRPRHTYVLTIDRLINIALWAVLTSIFYRELFGTYLIAEIGSFNLASHDIALLFLLPLLFKVWPQIRFTGLPVTLLLSFLAIGAFNFLRGVFESNLTDAAQDIRTYLPFLLSFFLFAVIPLTPERGKLILKVFISFGSLLAILAILRHGLGNGLFRSGVSYAEEIADRPLEAPGALVLGQAAAVAIGVGLFGWQDQKGSLVHVIIGSLFFIILLSTGQRSASLAGLTAIAVTLIFSRSRSNILITIGIGIAVMAFVIIVTQVVAIMGYDNFLHLMPESIQEVFGSESTLDWRFDYWDAIFAQRENWTAIAKLFGIAFGTNAGFFVEQYKTIISYSPHNNYIYILIQYGIFGTVLFYSIVMAGFIRMMMLRRRSNVDAFAKIFPAIIIGLLASQLVYSFGYDIRHEQGVMLGLALAPWRSLT